MRPLIGARFRLTLSRREALEGYIAISPWIAGFLLFVGGPILASLVVSFTEWPKLGGASIGHSV
ncbi:MAG: hypothetical protein QME94_02700, partial [Anaerolineae bacterium]|nr:hypothetical protein [Anaerolineae bacterium]